MSERSWHFYLDDMICFTTKVLTYTEGLDQAAFTTNALHYDADPPTGPRWRPCAICARVIDIKRCFRLFFHNLAAE